MKKNVRSSEAVLFSDMSVGVLLLWFRLYYFILHILDLFLDVRFGSGPDC